MSLQIVKRNKETGTVDEEEPGTNHDESTNEYEQETGNNQPESTTENSQQTEVENEEDAEELRQEKETSSSELSQEDISITQGDFLESAGTLVNMNFLRDMFGTGVGAIVGEVSGESIRVATGQTGSAGLLTKGAGAGAISATSLFFSSFVENDAEELMEAIAIGSAASFVVNVANFASGGSPTTALGATSQFAASMGARARAAQLSGNTQDFSNRSNMNQQRKGSKQSKASSKTASKTGSSRKKQGNQGSQKKTQQSNQGRTRRRVRSQR